MGGEGRRRGREVARRRAPGPASAPGARTPAGLVGRREAANAAERSRGAARRARRRRRGRGRRLGWLGGERRRTRPRGRAAPRAGLELCGLAGRAPTPARGRRNGTDGVRLLPGGGRDPRMGAVLQRAVQAAGPSELGRRPLSRSRRPRAGGGRRRRRPTALTARGEPVSRLVRRAFSARWRTRRSSARFGRGETRGVPPRTADGGGVRRPGRARGARCGGGAARMRRGSGRRARKRAAAGPAAGHDTIPGTGSDREPTWLTR